ncbi:MAG: hypothetical protein J6V02_05070 [Bacteroidaceae bacterium]|nr:hypothetical protein [Bacteroidaceae bacterium]
MLVNLYSFEKKKNSTKQPLISSATTLTSVQLKDETSIMNPVLLVNPSNSALPSPFVPSGFNYANIPSFGRYYYISDWTWKNGIWECTLNVDVLASFKTAIGNTSAYVERSASMYDSNVVDGFYPMKADATVVVTDFGSIIDLNTGCYVVGIIDCMNTNNRKGAVTYYAMTESELNSLLQFLYSGQIFQMSNITDISEGLFKSIMNPAQYIVSCMWMPVSRDTIATGSLVSVVTGYWDSQTVFSKIANAISFNKEQSVVFTNHPQISRGAYLNFSPFSRYTLFFPPFGSIPIDSIFRSQGSYLNTRLSIDLVTGQGCLRVSVQNTNTVIPYNSQKVVAERSALVGVPIQLSQVNNDMVNGVTSLVGSAISALTGGGIAGAASGVMSGSADMATARAQSTGFNGSFLAAGQVLSTSLVSEFYTQVERDTTDHGAPLMAVKTINSLSGYIKCSDGHFSGQCFDSEKDAVNSYMVSGFYYE